MIGAIAILFLLGLKGITVSSQSDLTIISGQQGTNVVLACIGKIDSSRIFPRDDQQLIRRIAHVETNDGQDPSTYSDSSNNGGIWQLGESKYMETKQASVAATFRQKILEIFAIDWSVTTWADLRKPFYSALAARLYIEIKVDSNNDFPFSTDIASQSEFWKTEYSSSSSKTEEDYAATAVLLNEQERCEVDALDLFYLLDDSGSLTEPNFNITRDFIYNMTENFPVASDRVRVGLITFEYTIRVRFFLNTHNTKEDVLEAIASTPYVGIGTNTSGALEDVRIKGFVEANGARPKQLGVPRIAIVVTDGRSFEPVKTAVSAERLHNTSVVVYAIGIANADEDELLAIASDPRYAISVATFDEAILSALQVSISKGACQVSQSIGTDDVIDTNVTKNATRYVDLPLPPNGITIKANSTSGNCLVKVFGSTFITTPNEAVHDIQILTNSWGDDFLNVSLVFNKDTATRLYLAISGADEFPCTLMISAEEGDVSTDPVQVSEFPPSISKAFDDELNIVCTASGKPKPTTIQWSVNGTLLVSGTDRITITDTMGDANDLTISSTLNIQSLDDSNKGVYTCTASNEIPNGIVTDFSSFTLTIKEACPVVGTELCAERIKLFGCEYLAMINESNVPLPCRDRLGL